MLVTYDNMFTDTSGRPKLQSCQAYSDIIEKHIKVIKMFKITIESDQFYNNCCKCKKRIIPCEIAVLLLFTKQEKPQKPVIPLDDNL